MLLFPKVSYETGTIVLNSNSDMATLELLEEISGQDRPLSAALLARAAAPTASPRRDWTATPAFVLCAFKDLLLEWVGLKNLKKTSFNL